MLDEIDILEIAAKLRRDPRTVRKVARGGHIRGRIGEAEIRREVEQRKRARHPSSTGAV